MDRGSGTIYAMIDTAGRRRIAELVRAQMAWEGLSGPGIARTGRVSRATVDRVKRLDVNVSNTMLRALGDVLGLPRDFLIYVGAANVQAITESGADPDLIRWVLFNLFPDSRGESDADGAGNGGTTSSQAARIQD